MTPIQIQATIPDEPPAGSVVLDHNGRAWQNFGGRWMTYGLILLPSGRTWPDLLAAGPVTLIYRADAE